MYANANNKIELSLIIVAYENWKVVKDELESLEKYNDLGTALEVIVVDNSSEEKRVGSYLNKEWSFGYTYVESVNKGFGYGNNRGAELAKGNILGFVNPDIIYIEPIFKKVLKCFEDSDVIMVGNKMLNTDRKWTFSFYNDYRYSVIDKNLLKFYNKHDLFNEKKMYIAGCDMFVRKNDFFEAGMFDENIFMYYEEPDLTRRIRKIHPQGHVVYSKDTHMIHLERASTPKSDFAVKQELKSCVYYGRKYNLDYKAKIKADYRYNRFVCFIAGLLGKNIGRKESLDIYKKFLDELD